jgi:hypothetical protein
MDNEKEKEKHIIDYLFYELKKVRLKEEEIYDLITFIEHNMIKNKNLKTKGLELIDSLSNVLVDITAIVIYLKESLKLKIKDKEEYNNYIILSEPKHIMNDMNDNTDFDKYNNMKIDEIENEKKILNNDMINLLLSEKYQEFMKKKDIFIFLEKKIETIKKKE